MSKRRKNCSASQIQSDSPGTTSWSLPVLLFSNLASTNFCATWKSPKSTASARDGENPTLSPNQPSLSPSPVHFASAQCP